MGEWFLIKLMNPGILTLPSERESQVITNIAKKEDFQ